MNGTTTTKHSAEETFFLTKVLGAPAYLDGRKLGKLKDMVAIDHGKLAEVTHFQIARAFGEAPLVIPFSKVRSFSPREIIVDNGDSGGYMRPLRPEEVLLRDYLLDKKVLDMEGREIEVVYDMRLVRTNSSLCVSDVDISRYGLLRRLGPRALADYLYRRAGEAGKRLIPWSYIQALSPQLGSLQGNVKLTVLKEQLSEIQPSDLADIVEELDSAHRVALLKASIRSMRRIHSKRSIPPTHVFSNFTNASLTLTAVESSSAWRSWPLGRLRIRLTRLSVAWRACSAAGSSGRARPVTKRTA